MFKVFTICGHDSHFGHVTWTKYITSFFSLARRLRMKFKLNWLSSFREEVLENVDHGRRLPSYKLPRSPWLRGGND